MTRPWADAAARAATADAEISLAVGIVPPTRADTGLVDRRFFSPRRWADVMSRAGLAPFPLPLRDPDDLARLWDCAAAVNLGAEAYPEVHGAVALAAIARWIDEGGIWVEIAGAPFHFGALPHRIAPRWQVADTLFGPLAETVAADGPLRLTREGRRILGDMAPPGESVGARGGARGLIMITDPWPTLSVVETARGACVLSVRAIGAGYIVRWGGSAHAAVRDFLPRALVGLVRHLLDTARARRLSLADGSAPRLILDPLLTSRHRDVVVGIAVVNHTPRTFSNLEIRVETRDEARAAGGRGTTGAVEPGRAWVGGVAVPLRPRDPIDVALTLNDGSGVETRGVAEPSRPSYRFARDSTPPTRPADFANFWTRSRAELAVIPDDAEWTPLEGIVTRRGIVGARVRFRSAGGVRISGILCRPDAPPGPVPGVVVLPGYKGVDEVPERLAAQGLAALTIDVRGVGPSASDYRVGAEGLLLHHLDAPERYGYRGALLDCLRALDVLSALSDVDGGRLGVVGVSQGGGLALMVGALDTRVRAVVADVPFLCDITRSAAIVAPDAAPLAVLGRWLTDRPARARRAAETLRYVDAANFVADLRCPTLLAYAPDDYFCPVAGVRTVIARLRCPLTLRRYREGHSAPALLTHRRWTERWITEILGAVAV